MSSHKKLVLLLVAISFSLILIDFLMPVNMEQSKSPIYIAMAAAGVQASVDLGSDQSFSSAAGSTVEYNVYIENTGKSIAIYSLSALSSESYQVEVWRDTDQIGSGDLQLVPPQGSTLTMSAGEVATLIVKVTIPSDAPDGTVDNTIVRAANAASKASDTVTLVTAVDSDLPHPSNWIQLGSDSAFPTSPAKIGVKAFYYTNDGSDVFFRIAGAEQQKPNAFRYSVYMDLRTGGQQIADYNYDYLLSSDGILYEWNGANWINSGYPTHWQVDGTAIVLWADLDSLIVEDQEIHFLACTSTKSGVFKDEIGPYTILKNNISEIPLIAIPILVFAAFLLVSKMEKTNSHTQ